MSDPVFYLGPLGAMQAIASPRPGLQVGDDESAVVSRLLTGRRHAQLRAPSRDYTLTWDYLTVAEFSVISALRAGVFGPGPVRLLDPWRPNRLSAEASAVAGSLPQLFTATAGTIVPGTPRYGYQSAAWTVLSGTATGARLDVQGGLAAVPVLSGEQITGSVYVTGSGLSVAAALAWYDIAGAYLSTSIGAGAALTGAYVRRTVTASAPAGAVLGTVAVATTTSPGSTVTCSVDQLQFDAAAEATEWVLGEPVPRLAFISRPLEYSDLQHTKATVELVEV